MDCLEVHKEGTGARLGTRSYGNIWTLEIIYALDWKQAELEKVSWKNHMEAMTWGSVDQVSLYRSH